MQQFLPSVVSCSPEAEVVVADNGSTDGSMEWLEREYPQVRRIVLDKNYGFAEGYNQALARVEAEYYVLLNNDVEVTGGWLRILLDYMDLHPEVAACQPKLRCQWKREDFEYAGACGGFLDAFTQMCAYPHFGSIKLFRGMPAKWHDVSIDNLLLPGGGRFFAQRGKTAEVQGGTRKFKCEEE